MFEAGWSISICAYLFPYTSIQSPENDLKDGGVTTLKGCPCKTYPPFGMSEPDYNIWCSQSSLTYIWPWDRINVPIISFKMISMLVCRRRARFNFSINLETWIHLSNQSSKSHSWPTCSCYHLHAHGLCYTNSESTCLELFSKSTCPWRFPSETYGILVWGYHITVS